MNTVSCKNFQSTNRRTGGDKTKTLFVSALQTKECNEFKKLPIEGVEYFVQIIGADSYYLPLQIHTHHEVYLAESFQKGLPVTCVQTKLDELPLQANSVDLILLPHVLEFQATPLELLNEAYEALKPNGSLIIFTFNRKNFSNIKYFKSPCVLSDKKATYYSINTHYKWLKKIGFEKITHKTFGFSSPNAKTGSLFIETLGQMLCPNMGSVMMIHALKTQIGYVKPINYNKNIAWGQVTG